MVKVKVEHYFAFEQDDMDVIIAQQGFGTILRGIYLVNLINIVVDVGWFA